MAQGAVQKAMFKPALFILLAAATTLLLSYLSRQGAEPFQTGGTYTVVGLRIQSELTTILQPTLNSFVSKVVSVSNNVIVWKTGDPMVNLSTDLITYDVIMQSVQQVAEADLSNSFPNFKVPGISILGQIIHLNDGTFSYYPSTLSPAVPPIPAGVPATSAGVTPLGTFVVGSLKQIRLLNPDTMIMIVPQGSSTPVYHSGTSILNLDPVFSSDIRQGYYLFLKSVKTYQTEADMKIDITALTTVYASHGIQFNTFFSIDPLGNYIDAATLFKTPEMSGPTTQILIARAAIGGAVGLALTGLFVFISMKTSLVVDFNDILNASLAIGLPLFILGVIGGVVSAFYLP